MRLTDSELRSLLQSKVYRLTLDLGDSGGIGPTLERADVLEALRRLKKLARGLAAPTLS